MNLTALIVTYNRLNKLKESVTATLALPFQYIVIIDNASTDGTGEWLKTLVDKRIYIVKSKDNCGGAGGFRLGAEWIIKNIKTQWIVFYDDDAYPSSDFISLGSNEFIDINTVYACNVKDKRGTRCKMNIPWKKYPKGLFNSLLYNIKPGYFLPSGENNETVVSVSFVGMVISFEMLSEHYENINDKLFIYFDDVYFSYNLLINNIPMVYIPGVLFIHDVEMKNSIAPWKLYYLVRNLILSKCLFRLDKPFKNVDILLRIIKSFFIALGGSSRKESLYNIFLGIRDGYFCRSGKKNTH